jgi:hypothetical protein
MSHPIKICGTENPNRRGDVIFVHGLNGDARTTWQPEGQPERFWPEWIGEDLLDVGVWSVGYPASAFAWNGSTMPLADRAVNILKSLHTRDLGTNRPVVFITHSLGGLLVKEMLRKATDRSVSEGELLAKNTQGIVFLSTPHAGSNLANYFKYLRFLLPSVSVKELQTQEPRLRELNTWYRNNVSGLGIKTEVYCERRKTPIGKNFWGKLISTLVVDESSSDPGIAGVTAVPMDDDHITISRPTRESDLYEGIKKFVDDCLIFSGEVGVLHDSALSSPQGPNQKILNNVSARDIQTGDITQIQIINNYSAPLSPAVDIPQNLPSSSRGLELTINILSSKIEQLSSDLSNAKAQCLKEYRELYYQGKFGKAYDCLNALRNDDNWEVFEKPLQAKVLQALSGYAINVEQDTDKARALAKEARTLYPEGDDVLLQVLISYYSENAEVALGLIENPSTTDLLNLKLGFLLELERADEVIFALHNLPKNIEVDTETLRLHALALITQGDIAGAQVKIQQALYEKPHWEKIRVTEATINYFSALSPAVPCQITAYPIPVPLSLVKQDDESLQRLRKAKEAFQNLVSQTERGEKQRKHWQYWQLACLANDPEEQSEASKFCSVLLAEDSTDSQAISWGIVRNYEIDLSPSQKALEVLLEDGNADLEKIIALVGIYESLELPKDALDILTRTREVFEQAGYQEIWLFQYVYALALKGEIENALREAEAFSNPKLHRSILVLILQEQAKVNGNWQALADCLESFWRESGLAKYLLELCELRAKLKDWGYVADNAETLVTLVSTPEALSLVSQCASHANRPELCLKLLNNHQQLFPGGVLPPHLHKLKAYCQVRLGQISQGVTEAKELVRSHETADTLITLMDLQLNQGDLRGAAITASHLLKQEDIHSIPLLRATHFLLSENRNLAIKLWRRAVTLEITPDILGNVITLGFKLGLEPEIKPFILQANQLAANGEGPFHTVEMSELLTMQRDWTDRAQEINQHYDKSELPVHFVAQSLKLSLTKIFRVWPKINANDPNPHFQTAILVRYGSRPFPTGFTDSNIQWQLHLDISAFLLAAHLEILDEVEQQFSPIYIPQSLSNALQQECEYFLHQQPSLLNACREIMRLYHAKQLRKLEDSLLPSSSRLVEQLGNESAVLLEQARVENGFVVEFLPLEKLDNNGIMQSVILDEADHRQMINCSALVEVLKNEGILSSSTYQEALDALCDQRYVDLSPQLPSLGDPIFVHSGLVALLARSDLLAKVCRHFKVTVSDQCIRETQAEISNSEYSSDVVGWLRHLIQRIATGLDQGTYELVAVTQPQTEQDLALLQSFDANGLTVRELLGYTPQPNDVIWIDDRFFSKHLNRDNSVPIIGVLEILEALRIQGNLNERKFFDKILQLRRENFRYIPITSQEVLYHLKEALVRDGRIQETEELAIIRRYIASCLLDSNRLQILKPSEMLQSSDGEMMFVFECCSATLDSIIAVWADSNLAEDMVIAYCNWILSNLYTGIFGVRHLLPNGDQDDDGLDLICNDITTLYFRGIQLWGIDSGGNNRTYLRRQQYFEWLDKQIIGNRFRSNPELISMVARLLKDIILRWEGNQEKYIKGRQIEEQEALQFPSRLMLADFYRDLPNVIKDELKTDSELMSYLQAQMIISINCTHLESSVVLILSSSDFFPAIASAINGREANIIALQPEVRFKVLAIEQPDAAVQLHFVSETDSTIYVWQYDLMTLASENPSIREHFLRSHRICFDCDDRTFERVVNEIVSISDVRRRIDQTIIWQRESAAAFYWALQDKINTVNSFLIEDLIPPSSIGLLRHFYLDQCVTEDISFHEKLNRAAELMLTTEKLEICIEKLSCFPVELPVRIKESFKQLSDSEKSTLLQGLIARLTSPVCKLHLIGLALIHSSSVNIAQELVDELYSENGKLQFQLFKAILNLITSEFSYWHETLEWPVSIRLAMIWAHTSRLYNLLYNPEISLVELVHRLEECGQQITTSADVLNRNPEFWNDVLHPHNLNRMDLVVHGLSAILKDLDPNMLQSSGISDRVSAFAVRPLRNLQILDLDLLHDLTLAQDILGSLLGGNRSEYLTTLLGTNLGQQVSSDFLKETVESSINTLISDQISMKDWQSIIHFINDLPIYSDLVEKLNSLIQCTNFIELYNLEPFAALSILMFACDHVSNTANEELRTKLEDELVDIARLINDQERSNSINNGISALILECTLKLALRHNNPRKASSSSHRLFERVFSVWNRFGYERMYGFSRAIRELPANQLHGAWTAYLLARASFTR